MHLNFSQFITNSIYQYLQDKEREWHTYAQEGNQRKLKSLFATSEQLEQAKCVDTAGMTLLHKAVIFEQLGTLKTMLETVPELKDHRDHVS